MVQDKNVVKWIVNPKNTSKKGCDVTLRFSHDSNSNAIDTVKKILISSSQEYRDISSKQNKKIVDYGSKL